MKQNSIRKNANFKVKSMKNILSVLIVIALVLPSFTTAVSKGLDTSEENIISDENFEGDIEILSENEENTKNNPVKSLKFIERLVEKFPNLGRFPLFNRFLVKEDKNIKLQEITNAVVSKLEEKSAIFSSKFSNSKNSENKKEDISLEKSSQKFGVLSEESGLATVVPEAGHIAIMGTGEMSIDTTLDINGTILVTLQGSLYMDTNMESIDIWWNLSSGYFEINADALSDGEPFELHNFLIDIRDNNSNPRILTLNIGFLSADAGGHILIEDNMAIGSLNLNGVFQIQDVNVSAIDLPFGDLTLAGSIDFYAEIGADDLTVSWNETMIAVDGSAIADGNISIKISDFYLSADLGVIQFESLDIYGDILLYINSLNVDSSDLPNASYSDVIFSVSGKITLTNVYAIVQGKDLQASLIDTEISLLFISRDSGNYNHIEGSGYLEIKEFNYSTMIGFKRLFLEGNVEFTQTETTLYFYLSAYAQVEEFHLSSGGIFVEFKLLTADVYVILETAPQSFKLTAGGYVAVKELFASAMGITVSMKCGYIGGNGYIWFHVGTLDAHASLFLATSDTYITGMGHSVYWSSLSADASIDLHIGGNIEATLGLTLSITNFNLDSGLISWTSLYVSAAGSIFIGGNKLEFSGSGELSISNGHFSSYIEHVTGTLGVYAGGTATFKNNGGSIEFSGSAGAYVSGLTFVGSGIGLTLSSFSLNVGGSGTFQPKTNGFVFDGTADLSVSSLVVTSPYDINIPSLDFEMTGGHIDVQATGVSAHVEANGKISTGYVSINGLLIQTDLDGNIVADLDIGNAFVSIGGSGYAHVHYEESASSVFDVDISGLLGSASIDFSSLTSPLSGGSISVNTGGGELNANIIKGADEYSISASGDITGNWNYGGNQFQCSVSSSDTANIAFTFKRAGSELISIDGSVSSAYVSVVLQPGSGNFPLLPPDYCNIILSLTGTLDFTLLDAVKFSLGDTSGSLLWDKFAEPGSRLSISGDISSGGSLHWWHAGYIQILPWPWNEGDVTLKAKDKNGAWKAGSADVNPGQVNFLATVNIENEGSVSYRYDFFWGDGTPGESKNYPDSNCLASHEYQGYGSYTAEVKVYEDNWLIGVSQVTVNIGTIDVSLSSNKRIYNLNEQATYTASVNTDNSNNNQNHNNYDSFASDTFSYVYDFNFGDGDEETQGPKGTSAIATDECNKASGMLSKIKVTVDVTEVDSSGNPTGRAGSASCSINVLGGLLVTLRASKNLPEVGEDVYFTAKVLRDDSSSSSSESTNFDSASYESANGVYEYNFDFGDGLGASNGPTPETSVTEIHAYGEKGARLAVVTVTNTETGAQGFGYAAVLVNGGLSVTLTASPKTPAVEEQVTFTATVSEDDSSSSQPSDTNNYALFAGNDYEYTFEFRDGTSETVNTNSVTHAYLEPGTYIAKVTVVGDEIAGAAQTTVYVGSGDIVCSPEVLDFGLINPGETKTQSFTVTNVGDIPINWASTHGGSSVSRSPGSGSLGPGESTSVSVTVTAPEGGSNSNSESNNQASQQAESTIYSSLSSNSIMFESEEEQQVTAAPLSGGNNHNEDMIRVYNTAQDSDDSDTVVISYNTKRSSPVADAGISMTISQAKSNVAYQTIPQTFINSQGQPMSIDNSYSVKAKSAGNYDVEQYGTTVAQNVGSAEAAQSYAATGGQTNEDDEDDEDSDSSSSNSSSEQSEPAVLLSYNSFSKEKDDSDSISDSEEDDDSKVSVQFNGAGTILSTINDSEYFPSQQLGDPFFFGCGLFIQPESVSIENVKQGDSVISSVGSSTIYSTSNPEVFTKTSHLNCNVDYVTIGIELNYIGLVAIDIETGQPIGPTIDFSSEFSVTSDYLVLVNGNYIPASKVKVGDKLFNLGGKDGYDMVVKSVEHNYGYVKGVFDLTLSGFGGFFANGGIVKSPNNYGAADSCSGVLFDSYIYVPVSQTQDSEENVITLSSLNQQSFSGFNQESLFAKKSSGKLQSVLQNMIKLLVEKFPSLANIKLFERYLEDDEESADDSSETQDEPADEQEDSNDNEQENINDDENNDADDIQDDVGEEDTDSNQDDSAQDDSTQDDSTDEIINQIDEDYESSYEPVDIHSVQFFWDFGDGETGFGVNPVHIYDIDKKIMEEPDSLVNNEVTYKAILMIIDENGNIVSSDTMSITIGIDEDSQSYIFSSNNIIF